MFNGFLEVVVFLERFRNVDLFQQGLYHLRLKIAKGDTCAQPYDCVKTSKADQIYSLIGSNCEDEDHCFSSSVFLIRYSEEEAQLRELCVFRYEANPDSMNELLMTVELDYSDFDKDFSLESLPQRLQSLRNIPFKSVAKLQVPIKNPRASILEPLVLEFSDPHKCVVLGCFACVLFDYRYRAVEGEKKHSDLLNQHIATALVVDLKGEPKLLAGADETDRLYEKYIRPQALAHETLRSYLCDLITRYIPLSEKVHYSDLPPPLSLPHYVRPGETEPATRFSEAVASHDAVEICTALMSEVTFVAEQVYRMLQRLRELLGAHPMHCLSPLVEKRLERLRSWSSASVRRQSQGSIRVSPVQELDLESHHRKVAKEQRLVNTSLHHDSAIDSTPGDAQTSPILFEDTYFQLDAAPPPRPPEERTVRHGKKHLFVLVHGFHGKSSDLRLVKHVLSCFSSAITVLCAAANEANTERDIFEMGESLAQEIKQYILEWLPGSSLGRISFIGYSLGGLIARAALPHLADFASVMHGFVTFSTPHLGHVSDVSIVGAGLWVLERFRRTLLLQQLLLTDNTQLQQTALYRLSTCPGLEWFQHVYVFSSYQDKYVPHDSARVEVSAAMSGNAEKGRHYMEMAKNILSRIAPERFVRVDVDFCEQGVSLDTVTGRSAHLMFVTNEHFLKLVVCQYPELLV